MFYLEKFVIKISMNQDVPCGAALMMPCYNCRGIIWSEREFYALSAAYAIISLGTKVINVPCS